MRGWELSEDPKFSFLDVLAFPGDATPILRSGVDRVAIFIFVYVFEK